MKNFKVGDKIRAISNIYDITSKNNEWEGVVTDVEGICVSAKTIKCKEKSWIGTTFCMLKKENFELIVSQEEKKTPFQYMLDYYDIKVGEVFLLNGEKFYFDENNVLRYENNSRSYLIEKLLSGTSNVEKLPWKAKNGDTVWKINTDGNIFDCVFGKYLPSSVALLKLGWLFPTKEEAERNKDRVLKEMKEVLNGKTY